MPYLDATYLIIRMFLLPMDQIVLVRQRLLVAEGTRFQGGQRLLASSRSHGARLASLFLDFPDDEAIFQEVLLYFR